MVAGQGCGLRTLDKIDKNSANRVYLMNTKEHGHTCHVKMSSVLSQETLLTLKRVVN